MGVGKKKLGKNRLDKYYHLAKEQGYRSRAAFKLIQLNRQFNILSSCRALLDLCAAPGGWLQVAAKTMPMGSLIMGVDLVPIKPIRGVKALIGDITTQQTRALLRRESGGSKMDVVLHDGAPNVGGAWQSEAYTQSALVLDSLRLAVEFLAPQGTFVTKVFRSKDYNALLYAFNQLFAKVESTKPAASRGASAEIFVVCQGYKAPAKVDPRLLDPKVLFQDVSEVKKVAGPEALLRDKVKQRRHREGYEEGISSSHRAAAALAFIASDSPVEMLGRVTKLVMDGPGSWTGPGLLGGSGGGKDADSEGDAAAPQLLAEGVDAKEVAEKLRRHAATTADVKALCSDLQVLGRSEFKQLLRWRLAVLKDLKGDLATGAADAAGAKAGSHKKAKAVDSKAAAGQEDGEDEEPVDPEEKLLQEMEAVKERLEHDGKKAKKKRREMKKKARVRAAQMEQSRNAAEEDTDGLFQLRLLAGDDDDVLGRVVDVDAPGANDMEAIDAPSSDEDDDDGGDSDADSDDERLRYEAELEEALEDSYAQYLSRKGVREEAAKEKRRRLGMDGELDGEGDGPGPSDSEDEGSEGGSGDGLDDVDSGDEEPAAAAKHAAKRRKTSADAEARRPSKPAARGDAGGLLVTLDDERAGVATSSAAMAAQWFKQDLFKDADLAAEDDDIDGDDGDADLAAAGTRGARREGGSGPASTSTKANGAAATASGRKGPSAAAALRSASNTAADAMAPASAAAAGAAGAGPATRLSGAANRVASKDGNKEDDRSEDSGSGTDSEDEFDLLDDQGKAEVLALAKRMLRRKEKESIVDAAYNRFAFHDTGMPRWFAEDERRHMRPIAPVTKEEVEAEKERLRAIDARPIKKVAEAKARKKMRVVKRLEQARGKATAIAEQDDVPMAAKMREIQKVYAKANRMTKGKKGGKSGGKKRRMDGPLKKEMRAQKRQEKKRSGKGGGRGKNKGHGGSRH